MAAFKAVLEAFNGSNCRLIALIFNVFPLPELPLSSRPIGGARDFGGRGGVPAEIAD